MRKAVVLLSGGADSSTTLYIAKSRKYSCECLIFDYGQRHRREVKSALRVAAEAGCMARVVRFSLPWGGSALTDRGISVPKKRLPAVMKRDVPRTYVPARNIIFLSFALSLAEATGAEALFIGANAVDFSGYPDCRPAFLEAFRRTAEKGTRAGTCGKKIKVIAPLLRKSKTDIVRLGMKLKVPYHLTYSCYEGGVKPCGTCDACILREKGFKEAGFPDPLARFAGLRDEPGYHGRGGARGRPGIGTRGRP